MAFESLKGHRAFIEAQKKDGRTLAQIAERLADEQDPAAGVRQAVARGAKAHLTRAKEPGRHSRVHRPQRQRPPAHRDDHDARQRDEGRASAHGRGIRVLTSKNGCTT